MPDAIFQPIWTPAAERTLENARRVLLDARAESGIWRGELSTSALSTAVAVFALSRVDARAHAAMIRHGLDWLAGHANSDGGWGDTVRSRSNLSTTALCWAAFSAADKAGPAFQVAVRNAEAWLACEAGGLEPARLAAAIRWRYGDDRTFSAPILAMCALARRLGPSPQAWEFVAQLPFELAACPHRLFKWLRLPVVSYALPALIAVGRVRHVHAPSRRAPARWLRNALAERAMTVLRSTQPASGGFLEAVPLTAFVVMSFAESGQRQSEVTREGVRFLVDSVRPDGSWPIDTDLATWVTAQSVNALAAAGMWPQAFAGDAAPVQQWLLNQQHRREHPLTHAKPGGWSWTDRSGGVPDADDTSGVLLALANLGSPDLRTLQAVEEGIAWLLNLQNEDGGIPTFCRGWGRLPFDRSCADLTAHAMTAMAAWKDLISTGLAGHAGEAIRKGADFLRAVQRADGAWVPLWFGNEAAPGEKNPVYGTARVLIALRDRAVRAVCDETAMCARAAEWLIAAQNADGGWGGAAGVPASIEETAVAVHALASVLFAGAGTAPARARQAVAAGVAWLVQRTGEGTGFEPSPIGFYFASLWYWERLYPVVFALAALERARLLDSGYGAAVGAGMPRS